MKTTHAQLSQIIKEELECVIKETREDNASEKNPGSKFTSAKNKSSLSQIDYISKELQKTVDWFEEVVFPAIEDNKFPINVDSRYMFDVDGLGLSSSEDRKDDGIDTAWRLRGTQGMRSIDKLLSIQGFENTAYPEAVQRHKPGRMSIGDIYGRLESLVIDNPKLKVRMSSDAGKVIDNIAESKTIKVTRRQLRTLIRETIIEEVKNTCWSGYSPGAKSGVKTKKGKGGTSVANCEEIKEEDVEEQTLTDFQRDPYKFGKTAADALDPISEPDLYKMQQVS